MMTITRPGDLWVIGPHRLICGSSADPVIVANLMGGERADLCISSPPYLHQRNYLTPIGDWNLLMQRSFALLPMCHEGQVLVNLGNVHRNGEVQTYWLDWLEWMRTQGWRFFGQYVWDKGAGLPGDWNGRLAPSYEHLFHFNRTTRKPNKTKAKRPGSIAYYTGKGMLRNPDGSKGKVSNKAAFLATHKVPDDVIRVRRDTAPGLARNHPAVFPVGLPMEIITAYSDPGQIIYEPFAGAGTTIIAAQRTGRRCYAVELQPEYCDNAIRRIQQVTGLVAVLDQSFEWFEVPNWLELMNLPLVEREECTNDNAPPDHVVI